MLINFILQRKLPFERRNKTIKKVWFVDTVGIFNFIIWLLLFRAMSASHESRKRNGDIRSGDITHEDVKRKYTEFHTCSKKNRQLLKSLNCNTPEDRCKLLSKLTNVCLYFQLINHVVQVIVILSQLAYIECRKFVMDQHTKQLQHLYEPPSVPQDTPELSTLEEWRDRRAAFGLLMSVSGINPTVMPDDIEQKVLSYLLSKPMLMIIIIP